MKIAIEEALDGLKKLNLPAYKEYDIEDSIDFYCVSVKENAKKNEP